MRLQVETPSRSSNHYDRLNFAKEYLQLPHSDAKQTMVINCQTKVESEGIIEFLKKEIRLKEVCHKIACQKIINQKAKELNLTVTGEEIQSEADRQRREKRLENAADTYAWIADQMITPDDWEAGIQEQLLLQKLKATLFAKETEQFFAQNRLNFDQIILYQIIVPYEKLAGEIFYQIEEEELSFYLAAHLYDIDEKRRSQCGYEGKLYRWHIKSEFAARIFAANPKEVIFPFQTEQGYHILMVEEFIPAQLTPEIYAEIIDKVFNEWLASELNYALYNSGGTQDGTKPDDTSD